MLTPQKSWAAIAPDRIKKPPYRAGKAMESSWRWTDGCRWRPVTPFYCPPHTVHDVKTQAELNLRFYVVAHIK